MTLTIKRADSGDVPALVDLMEAFYSEAGFPLDRSWATAAFEALLACESRGAVWLAIDDGSPVGHVVLTVRFSMEYGGLDAFIDDLFVQPGHRRAGVAAAALATLFDECRRRGVRAVHVEVGEDNIPAQRLYERFGLVPRTDRRQTRTVEVEPLA